MIKAGLIVGAVMLVAGTAGALFVPPILCIPCLALFAGVGGGYLAGLFDKPVTATLAARSGAGAGALGGVGAIIAHMASAMFSAMVLGPEGAADMIRSWGVNIDSTTNPLAFYGGTLGAACCMGLFEVALMAGVGALGGLLWWQVSGKNNAATPAAM